MKKLRYFCLLLLILPMCFLLSGCGKIYVTDIEKTESNGNSDIYTIYYSDGSTSSLSVQNGEDGENGQDLDLIKLYELCVENNLYEGDFQSFLRDYVNVKADTNAGIYSAMNSAVSIYSAFKVGRGIYEIDAGAGVIYKMDTASDRSYILTNCHVVSNYSSLAKNKLPEQVMVWQYGADVGVSGKKLSENSAYFVNYSLSGGVNAACVGYSADYDLAILQVSTSDLLAFNEDACAVTKADNYSLAEKVYAIGNPEAEGISVTSGIVSVVSEEILINNFPTDNETHFFRVMRLDAAIYGGNSGGGLFNAYGELVGIVNAGASDADNYNFALPIDNVARVADNLIFYAENRTFTYGLKQVTLAELGAQVSENYAGFNEANGQLTYSVVVAQLANGLLKNCGMQVGDIVESLTIDDQTYDITRYFQIDDLLISAKANSKISFRVLREGGEVVVNLLGFESLI